MKKYRKLYAIFKNGEHKGNERGSDKSDAIKNYVKASLLEDFLDDEEFMRQYSAINAINGIHHHYISYVLSAQ